MCFISKHLLPANGQKSRIDRLRDLDYGRAVAKIESNLAHFEDVVDESQSPLFMTRDLIRQMSETGRVYSGRYSRGVQQVSYGVAVCERDIGVGRIFEPLHFRRVIAISDKLVFRETE